MKTSIIAAVLLVLAVPALAAEQKRGDWSILFDMKLSEGKTTPSFYFREFATKKECLEELRRLQKRGPQYSDASNVRCGATPSHETSN
jgi:hypothetical protein